MALAVVQQFVVENESSHPDPVYPYPEMDSDMSPNPETEQLKQVFPPSSQHVHPGLFFLGTAVLVVAK